MSTFKVGDVVRLKGGGPNLTVSGKPTGGVVPVAYAGSDGVIRRDVFNSECLTPTVIEVKVPPEKAGDLYEALGISRPCGPDVWAGSDPSPPGKPHHDLGGEG